MTRRIATIGYEGATIEEFVASLRHASVDLLIDVRDVPISRKKGFSKNRLAEYLAAEGIDYVHLKGLGDPKEGREAARAGKYALFERIFGKHLRSAAAIDALEEAASLAKSQRICLMCFEADAQRCHRTMVADRLSDMTGLSVVALSAREPAGVRLAA